MWWHFVIPWGISFRPRGLALSEDRGKKEKTGFYEASFPNWIHFSSASFFFHYGSKSRRVPRSREGKKEWLLQIIFLRSRKKGEENAQGTFTSQKESDVVWWPQKWILFLNGTKIMNYSLLKALTAMANPSIFREIVSKRKNPLQLWSKSPLEKMRKKYFSSCFSSTKDSRDENPH